MNVVGLERKSKYQGSNSKNAKFSFHVTIEVTLTINYIIKGNRKKYLNI